MSCTLHVAWDDRLTSYDFGPGHPLADRAHLGQHGGGLRGTVDAREHGPQPTCLLARLD